MKAYKLLILLPLIAFIIAGYAAEKSNCNCLKVPTRFATTANNTAKKAPQKKSIKNMVWIPAGSFEMGGDDQQAKPDELPKRKVHLDGFWMDKAEVTNAQFREFVKATNYVTTAEKKPDWNELKKQLPPGTPKPPDDKLQPASLVFVPPNNPVPLNNVARWWKWVIGANWKHPQGPNSSIKGKDNYPVVQVSWFDAQAYCKWAGKRLPTEAQWEYAARGGLKNKKYPWGSEHIDAGKVKANHWQGEFPHKNTKKDGYYRAAPVKTFLANPYGLYDMAGNVWEWVFDYYDHDHYAKVNTTEGINNPVGPKKSYDPREQFVIKRVMRGGSFLCSDSYCTGYRVSARMRTSPDSSLEHVGFRCVKY